MPACRAARHSDALAYMVDRCRCPDAREGWRLYRKRLREGRHRPAYVPVTGSARRLRALAHLQWAPETLAPPLGLATREVLAIRAGRWSTVRRSTADRIDLLYRRLILLPPGPSTRAAGHAERADWAPPWAWDGHLFNLDDPRADPAAAAATCGLAQPLRRLAMLDHAHAVAADEDQARYRAARLEYFRARHAARTVQAEVQGDLFDLVEDGDPDGCSPYGCRSGLAAS